MGFFQTAQKGMGYIQKAQDAIDNLANKYIVTPLQKLTPGSDSSQINYPFGKKFVFDYEVDTNINLMAEITDHYTENNTAIQDHVAIHPVKITLKGFIGELVQKKPQGLSGAINILQEKLGAVPAYLGNNTPGMVNEMQKILSNTQNSINIFNTAVARTNKIINMGRTLFSKNNDSSAVSNQQIAYQNLESLFLTKQLVSVLTPYRLFEDMIIESLVFYQDENNKYATDITITLKQIKLAQVIFLKDPSQYQSRYGQQIASLLKQGKSKGDTKVMTSGPLFKIDSTGSMKFNSPLAP